jgi:dTDP-4-dehydrorhamnose reductase
MRICVTGARGMLGQQIVETATALGHTVIPWVRPTADVTQLESIARIASSTVPLGQMLMVRKQTQLRRI